MTETPQADTPFRLLDDPASRPLVGPLARLAEHTLGLARLGELHRRVGAVENPRDYVSRCLNVLRLACEVPDHDRTRIPSQGGVVVVANHPFGVIEGLVALDVLLRARQDVKILANRVLARFEQLQDHLICVDTDGGAHRAQRNVGPMLEAIRWVRNGGMLVVFPAHEVSHLRWGQRRIRDPEWDPSIARILRQTRADVLPIHFGGHNGQLFQLAGLAHPRLRTILLPRATLRKMGRTIHARIGRPIEAAAVLRFHEPKELVGYLRLRTLILGQRLAREMRPDGARRLVARLKPRPKLSPLIAPVDPERLAREVDALPDECRLAEAGGLEVLLAGAEQIPNVLLEIGRLREETFRLVEEGTGRALDLDRHDQDYLHLFVWSRENREVAGAYRLGLTDRLLARGGLNAVYTASLFEFGPGFVDHIRTALEVGRSFVTAKYQRSYMPLLLLWRGIGRFVHRHPRYHMLFGPVSISAAYQTLSRELMVEHLRSHESLPEFAHQVKPRHPVKGGVVKRYGIRFTPSMLADLGDVSQMVMEMETDEKGVPVLVREYLKLGGKILGFNVDPAFRGVVDGLVLVDLRDTDPRLLARYMGKDEAREFRAAHGLDLGDPAVHV